MSELPAIVMCDEAISKYHEAVRLYDIVISCCSPNPPGFQDDTPELIDAFNNLVGHFNSNLFPVFDTVEEKFDIAYFFITDDRMENLRRINLAITTIPPVSTDAGFIYAIIRKLMTKHKVLIDPDKLGEWDKFTAKYSGIIL